MGSLLGIAAFGALCTAAAVCVITRRDATAFALVGYLSALQPAFRNHVPVLPYLALHYFAIGFSLLFLLTRRRRPAVTVPVLFYALYSLIEIAGLFQSQTSLFSREVVVPSLVLMVFVLVSGGVRFSRAEMTRVVGGYLVGIFGLVVLIFRAYVTGKVEGWSVASNFAASGGMGPNQISFLLASGVFFVLWFSQWQPMRWKLAAWVSAVILGGFMVLTFSRGGLYILTFALALYYVFLRRPSIRAVGILAAYLGAGFLIFHFGTIQTEGALNERYGRVDTGRSTLARVGLRIFAENPAIGVGTGGFYDVVDQADYYGMRSGAHNELIRAAAEHGIGGLILWAGFAIAAFFGAARGYSGEPRAFRLTVYALALASVCYNGLKLTAQPFLFFIALSVLVLSIRQRARTSA
jgi:O-antigen ligase